MALLACRECGTQISDQAPICPKCGAPTGARMPMANVAAPKRKMGCLSYIGLAVVVLVVLAVIEGPKKGGSSGGSSYSGGSAAAPDLAPSVTVSAKQILSDYKANEVAADQKYKGQIVQVSGFVGNIGKDILDNPYVTVGTGAEFELPMVQCLPDDSVNQNQLAGLSKKQKLTVKGKVTGLLGNVALDDCVIVP